MLCMGATSSRLPDRDELVRDVLPRLGDGATREHAEQAVTWAIQRFLPPVVETAVDRLVGVNEAAEIVGTTRANVLRWSNGQGRTDFPEPALTLSCGAHWDRTALKRFAAMNPQPSKAA